MPRLAAGRYSAALWAIVRAAYEGRDPDRTTAAQIRVEAIACDFGVHPNSIWLRCKAWRRPDWYSQHAGPGTEIARSRRDRPSEKRRTLLIGTLRQVAAATLPCPTVAQLCKVVDLEECSVRRLMKRLIRDGLFRIEAEGNTRRRIVFPDGSMTDWNVPPNPLGGKTGRAARTDRRQRRYRPANVIDLCARDATRLLRRCGVQCFDVGVHDGKWGQRWCVDGRIVDRSGLMECARLHTAAPALRPSGPAALHAAGSHGMPHAN